MKLDSTSHRPEGEAADVVYSNFDHQLNQTIVEQLERDPNLCAQHAAWHYCGWVWRDAQGLWHEEVWRYKSPVWHGTDTDLRDLVSSVISDFGSE